MFEFIIVVTGVEAIPFVEESCTTIDEDVSLPLEFEIADADKVFSVGAPEGPDSIFDVVDTDEVILIEALADMDGNCIFSAANSGDVLSVEALGDTKRTVLCTELGRLLEAVAIDDGAAAKVPECSAELPESTAEVRESMVEVPGCTLVTEPLLVDDFVPLVVASTALKADRNGLELVRLGAVAVEIAVVETALRASLLDSILSGSLVDALDDFD